MSDQDFFSEGEEPTVWDTDSDGSTAHGQTHPFNARHPLSLFFFFFFFFFYNVNADRLAVQQRAVPIALRLI